MGIFIGVMIEMIIYYIIFANIRKVKINLIEAVIFFSLGTIAGATALLFIEEHAFAGILMNTALIVIMTVMAYVKIKILPLSIIYAIFTVVIILWAATFSSVILDTLTMLMPDLGYLGRDVVVASPFWGIVYTGSVFVIGFFISRKAGGVFHKRILILDTALQRKTANYLLLSAFVTLSLFFTNVFLTNILQGIAMYVLIYATILTISFIALAFAVFAFTDSLQKEAELKHNAELLQNLETYTAYVESAATEMRQFRHDHRNLMLGFYSHMADRDWDRLESYYSTYIDEFSSSETAIESCMDKLGGILTPELKTILFQKFLQVQRLGIKIVIEVENTVKITGDKNLLDTCRIAGIFMDNAMEACQYVEGAVVRLMCGMSGDNVLLVFQNTCLTPPPIREINKKGFTTKEGSRGLGLYNVSQLINKNGNISLQTNIKDGCFTQELRVAP